LYSDEEYEEFFRALGGAVALIVLDTHAVLWLAQAPELSDDAADGGDSSSARQGMEWRSADESLWEMAMISIAPIA
jgi:PIN domain nuclease of toxin-antitoxin system